VDPRTLQPTENVAGLPDGEELAVLLVPDMEGRARPVLLRVLAERHAVAGPARPWLEVRTSYLRALRALPLRRESGCVDTDAHLAHLVLTADPEALADLRARALAPLADLRPVVAEKLTETLRSWLLHHGRRDDVAAALFVHPQTVRYRMGQVRELFGDALDDPARVLELTVALGADDRPGSGDDPG
jgi:DNA-binding PucR family transcriptional regulator